MEKIKYYLLKINGSFWFLPTLILLTAIVSALGMITIDQQIEYKPEGIFKFVFSDSAQSAETILSTIAAAMIGLAGTVFSITLVVLTLASSQFGARLLRNFMYDRINQVVLGTYIATFMYCLLVLNTIKSTDEFGFIPVLSVFVATIAAVANIILLIIFIHHIATNIQTDKVIFDISKALHKDMERIFPVKIGKNYKEEEEPNMPTLRTIYRDKTILKSPKSGYLQSIDDEGIIKLAQEENIIIKFYFKPGDYMVENAPFCEVYALKNCSQKASKKIKNSIMLGNLRTSLQDAEFSIHQMVEIAARALSPGINDPYTAIACVDNLTSVLCYLTQIEFPSRYRYDQEDKLRVIADRSSFAGMMNASFNQIRQFGAGSPSVIIKMMEAVSMIHQMSSTRPHQLAAKRHADMLLRTGQRAFAEALDTADLKERYDRIEWVQSEED